MPNIAFCGIFSFMSALSSPDAIQDEPNTYELMAGVGNHEAKALLLLYLANSGLHHSSSDMIIGFKDFIGPGAIWYPAPIGPFKYCSNSLEPIGQVVRSSKQTPRGEVKLYGISEYGREVGVPTVGRILEWSLDYPNISVQQVFGPTTSKGATRAPENRIKAIGKLIDNPDVALSVADIGELDSFPVNSRKYHDLVRKTNHTVDALARSEVVQIDRQNEQNVRGFKILELDQPSESKVGRRPGIFKVTIDRFIQERYMSGQTEFTTEECVNYVIRKLQQADLSIDAPYARGRVTNILGSIRGDDPSRPYQYFPGLQRLEIPQTRPKSHTRVRLTDGLQTAIEALIDIVKAADAQDVESVSLGKSSAQAIAVDGLKKRTLLDKAYRFSAAAQKRTVAETMQEIASVLSTFDKPVDAQTIYTAYQATFNRPLTQETIRQNLRRLDKQGRVGVVSLRAKKSSRTKRNYYTLLDTEAA